MRTEQELRGLLSILEDTGYLARIDQECPDSSKMLHDAATTTRWILGEEIVPEAQLFFDIASALGGGDAAVQTEEKPFARTPEEIKYAFDIVKQAEIGAHVTASSIEEHLIGFQLDIFDWLTGVPGKFEKFIAECKKLDASTN